MKRSPEYVFVEQEAKQASSNVDLKCFLCRYAAALPKTMTSIFSKADPDDPIQVNAEQQRPKERKRARKATIVLAAVESFKKSVQVNSRQVLLFNLILLLNC